MKLVPDTSVVIDGRIGEIIENEYIGSQVIIPHAVVAELENQANNGRESGFDGLNELKYLQKLNDDGLISLSFEGRFPNKDEIKHASDGLIDALIRNTAVENDSILITSDKVQSEVAEAQGIDVKYLPQTFNDYEELEIAKFFDDETMSLHLKENVEITAKKGKPGNVKLVKVSEDKLSYNRLDEYAGDIVEKAHSDFKSFIEIEMDGAMVIQFRDYRISIARPPFSEALEITAVRPVVKVSLEEYELKNYLLDRLTNTAQGILIAGSPGAGKSTFAQAIADYLSQDLEKIVKTMESPRDLQVGDEITQYSPLENDMQKTADILLLVRPDYTLFDEVRKTRDFEIFADMRLAGVGMIGVVHATRPIDAIQRVISRLELGVIPSVIDTTIFIKDGFIDSVYDISMTVKVPTGMIENDLARPVIEVKNLETGKLISEIYTYGEQTIVMNVNEVEQERNGKSPLEKLVEKSIKKEIRHLAPKADVMIDSISPNRINLRVSEKYISQIIGKKGVTINKLEKKLGISLGVEPLVKKSKKKIKEDLNDFIFPMDCFGIHVDVTNNHIILNFSKSDVGAGFDIFAGDEFLFTATVGKNGTIRIRKDMELADILLSYIDEKVPILAKVRID